jgi:phosphatidylglycerophosphate synthase
MVGLVSAVVLVGVLRAVLGLGAAGTWVGIACATGLFVVVTDGLARTGRRTPGPADRVTLARAVLICAVAALVADTATAGEAAGGGPAALATLVGLASLALVLDALDGRVARRTGTVSTFGARFDMEADAFLILVLAVHVARGLGWWVLAVGAARYLLLAAQRLAPWLRGAVPARRWRKAVAAQQGVGLTAAASGLLPEAVAAAVVGVGLAALAVSFGTEASTLWRRRTEAPVSRPVVPESPLTFVGAADPGIPLPPRTTR